MRVLSIARQAAVGRGLASAVRISNLSDGAPESHPGSAPSTHPHAAAIDVGRAALRTYRFAIASALGFVVTELVLTAGLLAFYGRLSVPHTAFSSPELLGLDVLSFVVGVSASFFINERITVYAPHPARAHAGNLLLRFAKFQGVSWVGNAGTIAVQILLLATLDISPLIGTIIGAVVTYPIVYLISIRFVWKAYRVR